MRTSAERDADPGSVAVRANAEGGIESTQVESQMRHFPVEKENTIMPPGRLPSPRSRPTGIRTALKPADDTARLMMSFKAECRGKRSALRRHERGCRPYLSTIDPQRHLCGAQTGRPRRRLIAIRNDSLSSKVPIVVDGRQFIHASELGCVDEERHASRSWSNRGLKAAEREDNLMSSH